MLLAPSLAEPLIDVADERAQNSAPIDPLVLVKASVFARQHRIDEKRRDFVKRNLQPIRAGQAAVNFSVDVEDGVALRHFADLLHVEGLRPRPVKKKNAKPAPANRTSSVIFQP